jgi:hypothetical protein
MERLDKKYVEIFNNTSGTVSLKTDRTRLVFAAPTRMIPNISKKIAREDLMDIYNAPGVAKMFEQEVLLIKDSEARELLGLEELTEYTKSIEELAVFLKESSVKQFEDFIMYCSDQMLENLFDLAKNTPNEDLSKNEILRKYTGKDAYKMYQEIREENLATGKSKPEIRKPKDSAATTGEKPIRRRVVKE